MSLAGRGSNNLSRTSINHRTPSTVQRSEAVADPQLGPYKRRIQLWLSDLHHKVRHTLQLFFVYLHIRVGKTPPQPVFRSLGFFGISDFRKKMRVFGDGYFCVNNPDTTSNRAQFKGQPVPFRGQELWGTRSLDASAGPPPPLRTCQLSAVGSQLNSLVTINVENSLQCVEHSLLPEVNISSTTHVHLLRWSHGKQHPTEEGK